MLNILNATLEIIQCFLSHIRTFGFFVNVLSMLHIKYSCRITYILLYNHSSVKSIFRSIQISFQLHGIHMIVHGKWRNVIEIYRIYTVVCNLTPLSINNRTFSLSPDSVTPLLLISLNTYVYNAVLHEN